MAGIYIPGMEMPVTCCHCPLMGYDPDREWHDSMARTGAHICVLTGELIDNTKREDHCPLVPVPEPHGRLIDADRFEKANAYYWGRDFIGAKYEDCLCDLVNAAPTIIPAEEGET